ncbi:MAG: hypothetical protein ACE1S7_00260 [Candidatus Tisiphia sp.]
MQVLSPWNICSGRTSRVGVPGRPKIEAVPLFMYATPLDFATA